MKHFLSLFSSVMISIILGSSLGYAQEAVAIGGVTLKLCDKDGRSIATCVTRPDGSWRLTSSHSGEYTIVISDKELEKGRLVATATFADGSTADRVVASGNYTDGSTSST